MEEHAQGSSGHNDRGRPQYVIKVHGLQSLLRMAPPKAKIEHQAEGTLLGPQNSLEEARREARGGSWVASQPPIN